MLWLGENYTIEPQVVTKWEFREADNAWRLTLRQDLTFSNGDKMTVDDVEFTANMLLTASPPLPQRGLLPKLSKVQKINDSTIDFFTNGRDATMLYGLPYFYVLPKKYYESVGKNEFAIKPIGTGPYELAEFKSADTARYKLRTTAHPFRKPIPTEIIWRAIPDPAALISGIRVGELDIAWTGPSPDQADQAKSQGNQVITFDLASRLIAIDQAAIQKFNSPMVDKRVRLALNYAIDRDTLVKTLYKGTGQPLNQIAIPGTPSFNKDIPEFKYDVAKAKSLLAEAGYPNGFKVTNPLDYQGAGVDQQVLLAVQDYWKAIGVEVNLQVNELGVWVDKFYARNGQVRNELISSSGGDPVGALVFFRQFVTCNNPPERVIFCVPEFDRVLDQAYAEPDAAKREKLLQEAVKVHQAEITYIYMLAVPSIAIATPKVKGFTIESAGTFWVPDNVYRVD